MISFGSIFLVPFSGSVLDPNVDVNGEEIDSLLSNDSDPNV
jgi:hypothetical protein